FDDDDDSTYKKIDRNTYIFDGKTFIADVCKIINIDDDYFDDIKGDAESLAGVMLELRKEFPNVGEVIVYKDIKLTATAVSLRRIEKIKVDISALKKQSE
ncbi:MAG: hemolysin, partial [Bacteroidales bacterium]|nr:hemolysin [Bacteroidales bacterium]